MISRSQWKYPVSGHATIGPAGVVTGVTPGTDTIRYIVINLCGADTAIKIITIGNGLPSPGTITGPANVCLGSTITLSDMATGGSWSSASVNATINPSTGVLTGVAVGSALISYTIVTSCGTVAATKTINVNPLPPTGNITGIPNLCEGSSITLAGVLPGGKWSSGNPVVATIDSISGDVLALTPGNTVITYTTAPNTFGCINRTTFNITVHPAGTLVITDVTTPVKCNGEANGSIKATILGGSGSYQYLWSNGGTNQTIFNLAPGSYSVQVKDIVSNCTGTRTFNITEPGPLDITETITNEKCGTKNGSISLTVSGGIPPFKYVWSGPFTGTKIIGLPPDTYTVTVTDSNLCEKQIVAEVGADSCFTIHIHDVITPNGDGINDVWVIEGIHSYPENTVQVFDKFGDMVYSKQNYNNDWSGESSGGGHLPDGTYFYLVKLNASGLADEKNTITGSILIKQ